MSEIIMTATPEELARYAEENNLAVANQAQLIAKLYSIEKRLESLENPE